MQPTAFFIESSSFDAVEACVRAIAHPHALSDGNLVLVSVTSNRTSARRVVLQTAMEVCSRLAGKQPTVIIDKRLQLDRADIKQALAFNPERVKFVHAEILLKPDSSNRASYIHTQIEAAELDVRGYAHEQLAKWNVGKSVAGLVVGYDRLDQWVAQFHRLGANVALASGLLSQFRILTPTELFPGAEQYVSAGDTLVVVQDPIYPEKSAAVISNLLNSRFRNKKILGITDAIENYAGGTIHVFEDGTWTATELVGVLQSLLGIRPPGHANKVRPLSNPQKLRDTPIDFRFHATTDVAIRVFSDVKRDLDLPLIHLIPGEQRFDLFNASLTNDLPKGWYLSETWKSSLIEPQVLRDPSALSAADEHFLRTIGRQLWQNYLTAELPRRPNWKMWPGNRIDECSLGMRGFGMNVAFAHSAPKAMLPPFLGWRTRHF